MNPAGSTLLVLGASARAAAASAHRSGFTPVAADLFADDDLRQLCRVSQVADYPAGLVEAAEAAPAGDWLYTGALENYPDIVERIAATRPLLGNGAAVLRTVRDPQQLAAALDRWDIPRPALYPEPARPGSGRWLRKPLRSAGGTRISFWSGDPSDATDLPLATENKSSQERRRSDTTAQWYYQQWVDGEPASAVYLAAGGRAMLIGATRQLIGATWTGAGPFRYAGSIGPLDLADKQQTALQRIGACLATEFPLCGLFGVDLIVGERHLWPIEVNPRYTASVEVLERSLRIPTITWHVTACCDGTLSRSVPQPDTSCAGKAIVFARKDLTATDQFVRWAWQQNHVQFWPTIADIPRPGTHIIAGRPVATVLASGETSGAVESQLRRQVSQIQQLLGC